ncbi:3,5-dihydroxyphenylacetyl-CoA synthase DpgA [Nocardia brasiliensis]|uniref:Chalcone and stilbene synthase domain-containing protein n=1 Tax=Nocardia brasiliensis (strain ATCC 700358 / HUJEG-1) TaxID=1133849 RepID=K0EXA6_NOCB7|nr:3,5-dihydroxyphenylacetyl-CoA synthase DpgA [Nocardia brasiliensis]AFU04513.1 chalcone and stilbene synthase domain-containing protein [Nocardia brasiliensis ATCC 700358]OCF85743.1 stilbene synthase [Nocardia brasiliensis]
MSALEQYCIDEFDAKTDRVGFPAEPSYPRLLGVATATPSTRYSQRELVELLNISDPKIRGIFLNGGIETRHLVLPPRDTDGNYRVETQGELLAKHRREGVHAAAQAIRSCLRELGRDVRDIGYLVAVTTTGFLTPGFSALLINELGLSAHTARLDVVGMGCNAGLNGVTAAASWSAAHPGELAMLACSETCSAAYVFDGTLRTAVVNSLFGDGAAALAIGTDLAPESFAPAAERAPALLAQRSYMITHAVGAMRYDWDEDAGKFSFYLDKEVPYEVGAHVEIVVDRLLLENGLRRKDIAHWIVHAGGKKVIDAVKINLGLTGHDVRHTVSVMRDYGNLSSGSFLFSYQRLLAERVVRPGDYGILMTMGPGSQIETALLRF